MDLKVLLFEVLPILLGFMDKDQYIKVINAIFKKDSVNFKDVEYTKFDGRYKAVFKGVYFKDVLRVLYLNPNNYKKILSKNKMSFKMLLAYNDYIRVTSYDKDFKNLLVFLNNNGFFIKNPYKFNTINSFKKVISNSLYKDFKQNNGYKRIHILYMFNFFDYRLNKNKADSGNTVILYIHKDLYNKFVEWNIQKNDVVIKDKNSFYLNNNDKRLLKQIRSFKKPEFDKERFIGEIEAYNNRISIDWEKEALNEEYYHNMAFEYMEYNIDIDIDIEKESHIGFDIEKYPVIKAYYENGCIKYSHKPNGLLIKAQYKKELIKSKKINKNFKKSLLINYDSFYNRGFIQNMDL